MFQESPSSAQESADGIPNDTVKLVSKLVQTQNQEEILVNWRPGLRTFDALVEGTLGQALKLLEDTENAGDYDALDDIIREATGEDLITHGPDLVATGLVTNFNPKSKRIRRSALGKLFARLIQN